jgi:hypothetical protein
MNSEQKKINRKLKNLLKTDLEPHFPMQEKKKITVNGGIFYQNKFDESAFISWFPMLERITNWTESNLVTKNINSLWILTSITKVEKYFRKPFIQVMCN